MNGNRSAGHAGWAMIGIMGLALVAGNVARAHCDTMDGPVIQAAVTALERGDVAHVLKWVPASDEPAIREAFHLARQVRGHGPAAWELADRSFFETLVRLHRESEGATYRGIQPAGTPVPAPVARADKALEEGEVDDLARRIAALVESGIRERFAKAQTAAASMDESVEKGRAYVDAYVEFVHYVKAIHDLAQGHGPHHGHGSESPAPAHSH